MSYLLNAWYVAAAASELAHGMVRRTILGNPTLLFRTEDGRVGALRDSCPHRFAPLSKGTVIGNEVQCGYHGLRFGLDGRCVFNPHGSGATPSSLNVSAYQVVERHGYLWLWPGEQAAADEALLPDLLGFLSDEERYTTVRGYLHVKANYQLIVDNLLDLTHVQYVHPQFGVTKMSPEQSLKANVAQLIRDGDKVSALRTRPNSPPSDFNRQSFGVTEDLVDSRADMHWQPPANIFFDLGLTKPGEPEQSILSLPAAHMITPETSLTSHYFFAQGRDARRGDEQFSRDHLAFTEYAFREQDEPMLEAQQENMGPTDDLMSLRPALLQTDGAPLAARRVIERLIASERSHV